MTERQRDSQSIHNRWCSCDACTGADEGPPSELCDECGGQGTVEEVHAGQTVRVGCTSCRGTGEQRRYDDDCPHCGAPLPAMRGVCTSCDPSAAWDEVEHG